MESKIGKKDCLVVLYGFWSIVDAKDVVFDLLVDQAIKRMKLQK